MSTIKSKLEHLSPPGWSQQDFTINLFTEGDDCVAHVTGDLDLAARNQLFRACTAGNHPTMVVDISRLQFMDCSGYGGIVSARGVVEADARVLTIRGGRGQPGELLSMIAELDGGLAATLATSPSS